MGVDGLDVDLPTPLEVVVLDSVVGKAFFCTFQILFYALRPMMVYQIDITPTHLLNIAVQVIFDIILVKTCGWNALLYLVFSSFLAGSLHPCAGHFIAEHYVFDADKLPEGARNPHTLLETPVPETYSYYGILNLLTWNVGLHNEHHDFPAVPWSRLWKVNQLAKEFYDPLPQTHSWIGVIWNFILDPSVGMTCRVKRKEGGRKVGGGAVGEKTEKGAGFAGSGKASDAGWTEEEIQA